MPQGLARDALGDGGKIAVTVVVVLAAVVLLAFGFMYYMYRRERKGLPVFTKLEEVRFVFTMSAPT